MNTVISDANRIFRTKIEDYGNIGQKNSSERNSRKIQKETIRNDQQSDCNDIGVIWYLLSYTMVRRFIFLFSFTFM